MTVKLDLKNALINGSFEYFQRNTSFAAIADNTYTADRWVYYKNGTMVHTVSRSSDVPSSAFGIYSALIDCTTAQASIGASNYLIFRQYIEGNMFRPFKGKKIVFSFWVKATKTGTYCIAFKNATLTRSLIKEYSVSAANTWEKKTIRFEHDPSGSWNYDNSTGLSVGFILAAGSTLQTTPDSWQSGDYLATANQVNACDNIANNFQLADVCLQEDNEGQTREPDFQLAGRNLIEELQLCQRYYEKSYQLNTNPGTATNVGAVGGAQATNIPELVFLKVPKRVAPIIVPYSLGGVINAMSTGILSVDTLSVMTIIPSENNIVVYGSTWTRSFQFTADAEL